MKKIKVAIDNRPLTGADAVRGIGFHTRELAAALLEETKQSKHFDIEVVDFSKADLAKYDLVHFQSFHPHFLTLPFVKSAPKVVLTIHDLIRLVYPNAYPPGLKGTVKFWVQKFNLRNVDAIITISETSKRDIVKYLGVDAKKIHSIYLAPQSRTKVSLTPKKVAAVAKKYSLPKRFVLYVGDVNYNKNLMNLAKACNKASMPLVMVGKQASVEETDGHPENKPWKDFLAKYKNDKNVIRLGFLADEDFESIFKMATLYCQPSLYEGFGLPLLEAFERGLPVASADTPALKEVGSGAAVYFDPYDPADMAEKIKKIATDAKLRKNMVLKGKNRLKLFSWKKAAKQTLDVYRSVCEQ